MWEQIFCKHTFDHFTFWNSVHSLLMHAATLQLYYHDDESHQDKISIHYVWMNVWRTHHTQPKKNTLHVVLATMFYIKYIASESIDFPFNIKKAHWHCILFFVWFLFKKNPKHFKLVIYRESLGSSSFLAGLHSQHLWT